MLRTYYANYESMKLQLNLRNAPFNIILGRRIALNLYNEIEKYLMFKDLQKRN